MLTFFHIHLFSKTTYRLLSVSILTLMYITFFSTSHAQSICNGGSCGSDGSAVDFTSLKNQIAATPRFVNDGQYISQNDLRSNYPCGPSPMLGKYAYVMDVYQTVASVAICETDGNTFYWRPQRTDYATNITQTSGNINLVPFVTSPIVILSATPTGNVTITPSVANAWPGAQFHVYMPGTISLPYSVSINGLIGSGTLTAIQGRIYVITYTATGWKSN